LRIEKIFVLLASLVLLQACVTVDSRKTDGDAASRINVELGIGYLQQNNYELANEKLLKALQYDPDNVRANYSYAILQDRLGQNELAEHHYRIANKLDPKNPEAANNYGAFLCRNNREAEAEQYFLNAVKNPLYKTPEYALNNAATCLIRIKQYDAAKEYLRRALAEKSNFGPALYNMAKLMYEEGAYDQAKIYIDQYHLVARASAASLWLAIRNTLELDDHGVVEELGQRLAVDFPDSQEYQDWLKIQ
jgi:type IV pilus assembly protein PilF